MKNYLLKHSQKLSEKYPGKYVAIVENSLASVSRECIVYFDEKIRIVKLSPRK